MPRSSPDDLITAAEAASILGYDRRTVCRLATIGELASERRRPWLFRRGVVDRYRSRPVGRPSTCRLVEDLTGIRIKLDEGRLGRKAVDPPTREELTAYSRTLCFELDTFLDIRSKRHAVHLVFDNRSAMLRVSVLGKDHPESQVTVEKGDFQTSAAFSRTRDLLHHEYSQWIYFDRKLLILDGETTYLFKPMQRFHWTRGQALDDADLIIAETITAGEK